MAETGGEQERRRGGSAEAAAGGSFRVGSALGIPIRIHFTFVLILLFFGWRASAQGSTFGSGIVSALLLFGCVLLHELGHAAAAKGYGVVTRDIILYPIGGVARLEKMPSGKAELVIALAGPAVNFVLAALLLIAAAVLDLPLPATVEDLAAGRSVVYNLLFINLMLGLFNLVPAFPMDGGRVLRALLTFWMPEERATAIAAGVGQAVAILFGALGLFTSNFFLVFIALFVFLGAGQEAAFQRSRAAVAGLTARSAMVTRFEMLQPQDTLGRAAELLLASHQHDFPVVDAWGRIAGVLHRGALLEALARAGKETPVLEVMDREALVVAPERPLEEVLAQLSQRAGAPILVVEEGRLVGMITFENFGELVEVSRRLARPPAP